MCSNVENKFFKFKFNYRRSFSLNFRLQIRANEGRIDEHDMKLAGLTMPISKIETDHHI